MMVGLSIRIALLGAMSLGLAVFAAERAQKNLAPTAENLSATTLAPLPPTRLGLNLFNLAPHNRQQVFTNLISQSEWFSSTGERWSALPASQIDAQGWVTRLEPGQFAPRPLVLPSRPFATIAVRCSFAGDGDLSAGGIAAVTAQGAGILDIELRTQGGEDEGAWIQLDRTNPSNPLRDIRCADRTAPAGQTFAPAFIASLRGFSGVRFLDWQHINDNRRVSWGQRTRIETSSQMTGDGVAVENMIRLANEANVDPWFLMPYNAEAEYIEGFAKLVHDQLDIKRVAYVELGNEVWNDMFDAAQQARREGLAAGLAPPDDPHRAQARRYAQKVRDTMRIWSRVFADRPQRLVRVAATQNVYPDLARAILSYEDMPRWIDALATAPYIHLDLAGKGSGDVDWVFSRMPSAINDTIGFAEQHRAIAAQYGKRYITYEGGQHLVTADLALARLVQRDARMATAYQQYLIAWRDRIGDQMTLYASTAPIDRWGAWGLREYAGQPEAQTPKLRAVQSFLADVR